MKNKQILVSWPDLAIWWVCLSMTGWPKAARCEAWDGATTVSCEQPSPQNLSITSLVGGIPLLLLLPFLFSPPPPNSYACAFASNALLPLQCSLLQAHLHASPFCWSVCLFCSFPAAFCAAQAFRNCSGFFSCASCINAVLVPTAYFCACVTSAH